MIRIVGSRFARVQEQRLGGWGTINYSGWLWWICFLLAIRCFCYSVVSTVVHTWGDSGNNAWNTCWGGGGSTRTRLLCTYIIGSTILFIHSLHRKWGDSGVRLGSVLSSLVDSRRNLFGRALCYNTRWMSEKNIIAQGGVRIRQLIECVIFWQRHRLLPSL